MTRLGATRGLAEVFVEFADTLVDDFDLLEFLELVALRTTELSGAAATGLLLADHQGKLRFMTASEERLELLELFQVQIVEGPCQAAFDQRRAVLVDDLHSERDSWPRFAPRALELGFVSVSAFPLRLRDQTIGVLGLFGRTKGHLGAEDVSVVQALADVATIGLLQEQAIQRGEVLAEQLQGALNSRIVVEQAKGAVAQIYDLSVDEAFTLLRGYCRRNHVRLTDMARRILENPSTAPDLRRS